MYRTKKSDRPEFSSGPNFRAETIPRHETENRDRNIAGHLSRTFRGLFLELIKTSDLKLETERGAEANEAKVS